MNYEEFSKELNYKIQKIGVNLNEIQIKQFYGYMKILLEWNEKINLTAITDENEIILKHFVDCATIAKYVKEVDSVLDLGTGAGFPGIPLKIIKPKIKITLVDSLNKRINFLNELIKEIKLENIETIHSRAEELAKNKEYRESFDIAASRAVAPLNVLAEYALPFVKIGGKLIAMKGSNAQEEVEMGKKAVNVLGGKIKSIEKLELPDTDITRNIILIDKIKNTPKGYPRKAGKPSKEPIL